MKRWLPVLLALMLALSTGLSAVSAQRDDRDGDGIPNSVDSCPDESGPRDNRGCPLPPPRDSDGDGVPDANDRCPSVAGPSSNGGCPEVTTAPDLSDRDGDGVPDVNDRCPDAPGLSSNSGCPEESAVPATTDGGVEVAPAAPLPDLPFSGECVLATRNAERVNVRAQPSLDADIVGALDPQTLAPVFARWGSGEDVWARIVEGWVARWVVRMGGSCDQLPAVQAYGGSDSIWIDIEAPVQNNAGAEPPESQPEPPTDPAVFAFEVVGAAPGMEGEAASCSNNLHIAGRGTWILDTTYETLAEDQLVMVNWSLGAPIVGTLIGNAIGAAANDSAEDAATPEPHLSWGAWCMQSYLNPKGFTILSAAQDAGFVINWRAAFGEGQRGSEAIISMIVQPGGSNPPEPDAQGIIIDWHLPLDLAADGAHALYYDIYIPDPDVGSLVINWSKQQPGPPTVQGIIIDFTPGGTSQSDSDAQGIIIEWFPQGAGGGSNGMIIHDTAGGAEAPFSGRGVDIARVDGEIVSSIDTVIAFYAQ